MLLYASSITPRLQYISDFIGKQLLGVPFQLTSDKVSFASYTQLKINYGGQALESDGYWLAPHSLLFETTIQPQDTTCFAVNDHQAFFATQGDFPFDIFAASFYLLSRYEEYLPHEKDSYGRYAHQNSLAYKEGFLQEPLVNFWLSDFADSLQRFFPSFHRIVTSFSFLPTYDIDIAWSYRHKGWWRNAGGFLRSLFKGQFKACGERIAVLAGKRTDPFDVYSWLYQKHEQLQLKPYYFFLVAATPGRYDKNVSPKTRAMKDLVKDHFIRYPVGLHPSWQSGDRPALLPKEMQALGFLSGAPVIASRQHYIRLSMPATFRQLLDTGIRFDFSMGYGSINGFRASVASSYYWYDLQKEQRTALLLYPFCFMEANSYYEQGLTPAEAMKELMYYLQTVRSVNGLLVTIWHNHFLGTDPLYHGWSEVYAAFLEKTQERSNAENDAIL